MQRRGRREGGRQRGRKEGGGKSDRSIERLGSAFSSALDKETASSRSRQVERGVCVSGEKLLLGGPCQPSMLLRICDFVTQLHP